MRVFKKVSHLFRFTLFISCLFFVIQRGHHCFSKYLKQPISTKSEKHFAKDYPFPSLTLCQGLEDSQNKASSILAKCNLNISEYESIWVGQGNEDFCEDPKELFLKLPTTLEDLGLEYIYFSYFDDSTTTPTMLTLDELNFKRNLVMLSGIQRILNCHTLDVPKEFSSKGISHISLFFKDILPNVNLFLHQTYATLTDMPARPRKIDIEETTERVIVNAFHSVNTQLNFDGLKCESNEDYQFDDCIHSQILDDSLSKLGCSTPYGNVLDNICTDPFLAKNATRLFWAKLSEDRSKLCQYPCTFLDVAATHPKIGPKLFQNEGTKLRINFKKFITVTESFYDYTELELLAELGGYVGLFLGLSIFDLNLLFDKILVKLFQ